VGGPKGVKGGFVFQRSRFFYGITFLDPTGNIRRAFRMDISGEF